MKETSKLFKYGLVVGTLLTGASQTIVSKLLFQQEAKVNGGESKNFEKPILLTAAMAIGMFFALFIFLFQRQEVENEKKFKMISIFYVLAPAACDMVATILQSIALAFLYPSVIQMFRGSIVLFTWILSIFYLKRKNQKFMTISIFIIVIGLTIVGISVVFEEGLSHSNDNKAAVIVSIFLVIISQLIQAFQTILEDKFMHNNDVDSTFLVGMEGSWEFLIISTILLPVASKIPFRDVIGIHEDTIESFQMMENNHAIIWYIVSFIIICFFFNVFGMMVTDVTDAVIRNILEGIRILVVWIIDIILYWIFSGNGNRKIGEKLNYWSILDFFGFLLLIYGTLVYNGILRLPSRCFHDDDLKHEVIQSTLLEDLNDGNENSN